MNSPVNPVVDSAHHPCGPSVLGRRALCPGSLALERRAAELGVDGEGDTAAADEGTLLHARTLPGAPIDDLTDEQQRLVLWCVGRMNALFEGAERVEREIRLELKGAINE